MRGQVQSLVILNLDRLNAGNRPPKNTTTGSQTMCVPVSLVVFFYTHSTRASKVKLGTYFFLGIITHIQSI